MSGKIDKALAGLRDWVQSEKLDDSTVREFAPWLLEKPLRTSVSGEEIERAICDLVKQSNQRYFSEGLLRLAEILCITAGLENENPPISANENAELKAEIAGLHKTIRKLRKQVEYLKKQANFGEARYDKLQENFDALVDKSAELQEQTNKPIVPSVWAPLIEGFAQRLVTLLAGITDEQFFTSLSAGAIAAAPVFLISYPAGAAIAIGVAAGVQSQTIKDLLSSIPRHLKSILKLTQQKDVQTGSALEKLFKTEFRADDSARAEVLTPAEVLTLAEAREADAEARKADAEALAKKAEARKALTEARKALTEARKAEARKADAEARKALTEARKALTEADALADAEVRVDLAAARTALADVEALAKKVEARKALTDADAEEDRKALIEDRKALIEARKALTEARTALTEARKALTEARKALAEVRVDLAEDAAMDDARARAEDMAMAETRRTSE